MAKANPVQLSDDIKKNREFILRALTDPGFRELLKTAPAKAIGKKRLTAKSLQQVHFILKQIEVIEFQIGTLADELLCACSVSTAITRD